MQQRLCSPGLIVAFLILFPCASQVSAGISLVQHASKDAGTTKSSMLAFPSNNSAGNLIGVCIRAGSSGETFTVTDLKGNTYHKAIQFNETGNGNTLGIFYAESIAAGANTITVSDTTSATLRFAILEYSGVATSASLDVTATAQGSSTSPNSGNATTTASRDLLLGAILTGNAATFTAGSSYAIEEKVPSEPNTKLIVEDRIQATAGSASANASLAASDHWAAALAAFKAASGGSATPGITSLSPTSGAVGTSVTVTGTNFGSAQGTSTVKFNGTTATPCGTCWSATIIVVQVPTGATTGNVVVTVSGVASNGVSFTVTPPPSITSLSPSSGPAGASIMISGANFGSSGNVTFNGVTATVKAWSTSAVVAVVPTIATTGNVVITSNSTPSNGVAFTVTPPASVSGISVNSGTVGTSVTITGSNFGSTQASEAGTVVCNGARAQIASWSAMSIVAHVPNSAAPGSGSIAVSLAGASSNAFPFTVIPSLSNPVAGIVTSGISVLINGADLGSSQGSSTVNFGGVAPQVVNWTPEGVVVKTPASLPAGTYSVSITAQGITTNAVNFTIASSVTTIAPPAAHVGDVVTIAGTNLGSSGSISFNGVSAQVQSWANTTVTTQVPTGATSGPVTVTPTVSQVAGTLNFTVLQVPNAITSIVIEPASASLVVGDTKALLAVDSNGKTITGASWTVDNSNLASVSSEVPPVLTALAPGSITLTATLQNLTTHTTWTTTAAPPIAGTVQWSLPASELSVQQIMQATPTASGTADLFSFEIDPTGASPNAIRAVKLDGTPVWLNQSFNIFGMIPDPFGGVIVHHVVPNASNPSVPLHGLTRLHPTTGQGLWGYQGNQNRGFSRLAVRPDGVTFVVETHSYAGDCCNTFTENRVLALDAVTGQIKFVVDVPQSSQTLQEATGFDVLDASPVGPFTFMPDGSTVFEVFADNTFFDQPGVGPTSSSEHAKLYLFTVQPDGTFTNQFLDSYDIANNPCAGPANQPPCSVPQVQYFPGEVIPDGQGGLLASWSRTDPVGSRSMVTHINSGTTNAYSLPYHNLADCPAVDCLVLSDNGTVFSTNVSNHSTPEPQLFAFDMNSGSLKWAYQAPAQSTLSLLDSSANGALVAKTTDQNGVDTVLRFDSSGGVAPDSWTASGINNYGGGFWLGHLPSGGAPSGYYAAPVQLSTSAWYGPDGNGANAAIQNVSVSNFSQGGSNQTTIGSVLQKIQTALPNNSTCNNWLQGGGENTGILGSAQIQTVLQANNFGHATVFLGANVAYTIAAFSGHKNPNGSDIPVVPLTAVFTVNDLGAFFNATDNQGNPLEVGKRDYAGDTLKAQATILVHETAHQITVAGFQPDFGNRKAGKANDKAVDSNCRQLIEGIR